MYAVLWTCAHSRDGLAGGAGAILAAGPRCCLCCRLAALLQFCCCGGRLQVPFCRLLLSSTRVLTALTHLCAAQLGWQDEYTIKSSWWQQVFALSDSNSTLSLPQHFPNIKIINWFDYRTTEAEAGGNVVDWSVTLSNSSQVLAGFMKVRRSCCQRRTPVMCTAIALCDWGGLQVVVCSYHRPVAGACAALVACARTAAVEGIQAPHPMPWVIQQHLSCLLCLLCLSCQGASFSCAATTSTNPDH